MNRGLAIQLRWVLGVALALGILGGGVLFGMLYGSRHGVPFFRRYQDWSIGVLTGNSPLQLEPASGDRNPVLQASDVQDIDAVFVADPFLLPYDDGYVMFFEAFNREDGQGDIAVARSVDGLEWAYESVVLDEAFHVSYPYVFHWGGETYMVPETVEALGVFLYRATAFPGGWVQVHTLLEGRYVDPSLVYRSDRWWLFVGEAENDILRLFSASRLDGRFVEHPKSPLVVGDRTRARPAGRVLEFDGRLFRSAQDDASSYGARVSLFEILTLTTEDYKELPTQAGAAEGTQPWNTGGAHHLDAIELESGQWLAVADGWNRKKLTLDWP